ncbi:MAG TPA: TonB-dependent receptor [Steroidobacteraceae bacterium]|jgi:outer membrane receptor protein involved in Fe transport|nr:TonB-dependent receptor [Steroidobacteraceae bacterium]
MADTPLTTRRGRTPALWPMQRMTTVAVGVLAALYGAPSVADNDTLQEVIVTATRRSESAQNIPASITAITGPALEQAGIVDKVDLARSLAGINVTDKGPFGGVNGSTLIIRGLNSDSTSGEFVQSSPIVQPVATYVDDTPLFFNLRLQDLDRVELLRGPQGTLYGSGSLGGTIRFVQKAPDPRAFDAKIETGTSDTAHTHHLNYEVTGMLNLPVSETIALRLNAGYTAEAGFIDQPNLYALDASGAPIAAQPGNLLSPPVTYSKRGVNSYLYRTARAAVSWKPNDDFRAQLSYHHQLSTADGYPYAAPYYGLASLSSSDYTAATTNDKVDLAALTLEFELGFATLTSNSSWADHQNASQGDVTSLYDNFPFYASLYGANPRVLVTGRQGYDDKPWAEELRLASKANGSYDWVAGVFYKTERTTIREHDFYPGYLDYFNACVPVYGAGDGINPSQCGIGETAYTPGPASTIAGIPIVKDQAYVGDFETRYTDLAGFGEFTWHFAPSWSATAGARIFRQTVSQSQQTGLLFDGSAYIANITQSETWRKALWKVNVAYRIDESNLAYATWSQGFRRGAVNGLPPTEAAVNYVTNPGLFKVAPDTADNYEMGVKGTVQNRFRYSAAIYDIQWHNVQEAAFLTPLALPGAINAGEAYSRGLETELFARLTDHFSAQLDYTYDQTKLTSLAPLALIGLSVPPPAAGTPLPGTPKNTAAAALEYGHVKVADGELRFAANAHYQGPQIPAISATIPTVAGYTMVGARVGYSRPHWLATLYVDNLTNQLGVNSYTDPIQWGKFYQALVSRPRTIGLTVSYSVAEH